MGIKEICIIKAAVDGFPGGRKKFSELLGMRYSTLSNKLNGFIPLTDSDAARINEVLASVVPNEKESD